MYQIQGTIEFDKPNGYHTSFQIPTFYLDPNMQGIRHAAHALEIAREIVLTASCGIRPETHLTVYCAETGEYYAE